MATSNPKETFRTHANYIRAFAWIAANGHTNKRDAFQAVAERFQRSCPQVGGNPRDTPGILRSLHHAWSTELLLDVTAASILDDDEFARLANNWVGVQTYYAVYHATQAVGQAKGWDRPAAHPPTQGMFYALWAQLGTPLVPWGLAHSAAGWSGVPADLEIDEGIHPWVNCDAGTAWSIAAKALRTTREDAIAEARSRRRDQKTKARRREWREAEQARIAAGRRPRREPPVRQAVLNVAERRHIDDAVRPHTLIDYLYRLRVKTNYQDSAMFTDGPETATASSDVREHLRWLTASTLFVSELALAGILGGEWLRTAANAWLAGRQIQGVEPYLVQRQSFFANLPR